MRLHTYLPKENTANRDGLLSTSLTEHGWEKYIGRTGKTTKKDVLEALDKWQPGFARRYAISALADEIPEDAHKDFREFADAKHHYSFDTVDLIKAKILDAIQETNIGKRGTHPVDKPKRHPEVDWNKKPKKLLFSGIPHYLVSLKGGRIPPGLFRDEEKQAEKLAAVKTISDADAARIDHEARMSGIPALRAPSNSEWMNRIRSMWSGDTIRDSSNDNREPISPITDAVINTGNRIRKGQYVDAFNGVIAGLTEIGQGAKTNGVRQSPRPISPKIIRRGYVPSTYDQSRLAVAGYLQSKRGGNIFRRDVVGNLAKTDPSLIDSDVIIGMPRYKLRRLLAASVPRYDSGKESGATLIGQTIRGLSTKAIVDAANRGYETWPSTAFAHDDTPMIAQWDKSLSENNRGKYLSHKSTPAAVSYSSVANKVPSLIADGDTFSPTSGKVVELLHSGKTPKEIVLDWYNMSEPTSAIRRFYEPDVKSPYGLKLRDKYTRNFSDDEKQGNPTWNDVQDAFRRKIPICFNSSSDRFWERKFLDDVPFDGQYIQAAFIPTEASLGRKHDYRKTIGELNSLGIPFISFRNMKGYRRLPGDFGFTMPASYHGYEGASTQDKRALGVFRGALQNLKKDK